MHEKDLVLYLLRECGGLHSFHISRLLALLDIKYLREKGRKFTEFHYTKMPFGFYIDELPELLNELPVEKVQEEGYKYLKLKDDANVEINLPEDVRKDIEEILDEVCELSDAELNSKVLNSEYYSRL